MTKNKEKTTEEYDICVSCGKVTSYKKTANIVVYRNSKSDALGALLLALIGNACCSFQSVGIFTHITKENTPL